MDGLVTSDSGLTLQCPYKAWIGQEYNCGLESDQAKGHFSSKYTGNNASDIAEPHCDSLFGRNVVAGA